MIGLVDIWVAKTMDDGSLRVVKDEGWKDNPYILTKEVGKTRIALHRSSELAKMSARRVELGWSLEKHPLQARHEWIWSFDREAVAGLLCRLVEADLRKIRETQTKVCSIYSRLLELELELEREERAGQ